MEAGFWGHRPRIALLATLGAGGAAVAAALATGPQIGPVASGVEYLSGASGSLLGDVAAALPLGYAFGAGMVASVNPCGFALLPAYLGLYLGEEAQQPLAGRLGRALHVSAAVTLGFVLLFGVAGLALSAATSAIARYFPWTGLAIGVLLLAAGGRLLAGGTLHTNLGELAADRVGAKAQQGGSRGYLAYGLAYGAGSLSCTLPIFLAVVATSLAAGGFLLAASQFVFYGLGMGFVITALTVSAALFKFAALGRVRTLARYVQPAGSALMLLAGAYLIYYWLTLGGLLARVAA